MMTSSDRWTDPGGRLRTAFLWTSASPRPPGGPLAAPRAMGVDDAPAREGGSPGGVVGMRGREPHASSSDGQPSSDSSSSSAGTPSGGRTWRGAGPGSSATGTSASGPAARKGFDTSLTSRKGDVRKGFVFSRTWTRPPSTEAVPCSGSRCWSPGSPAVGAPESSCGSEFPGGGVCWPPRTGASKRPISDGTRGGGMSQGGVRVCRLLGADRAFWERLRAMSLAHCSLIISAQWMSADRLPGHTEAMMLERRAVARKRAQTRCLLTPVTLSPTPRTARFPSGLRMPPTYLAGGGRRVERGSGAMH